MIGADRRWMARTARWLGALLVLLVVAPSVAAQTPASTATVSPSAVGGPPAVSAAAWILVDLTTDRVIGGRDPHARLAVASLTKVMTAVVALRHGALDDELTVEGRDLPGEASIGLRSGERVSLEPLLYGLLMRSGNDAAAVIARGVGSKVAAARGLQTDGASLFLDLMNEQAAALGMVNTNFRNAHGLDAPNHYSSAYDLALLTRHALRDPQFARPFGAYSYPFQGGVWSNVNRLLYQYEGIIGGKTGIETQSGLCLIEVAERDGRRLAVIVLNAPQWYNDARALLDYGFGEARGLPATSLAPLGTPGPITGASPPSLPTPLPRQPVPINQTASSVPVLAVGTPAPAATTNPTPAIGGAGPEVVLPRGSGDEALIPVSRQPAQTAEIDWSSLFVVGGLAAATLIAVIVVGLALRVLRLGPLANRGQRRPDQPSRPPPWRTYQVAPPGRADAPQPPPPGPPRPPGSTDAGTLTSPPTRGGTAPPERVLDHLAVALRHLEAGRVETAESFFVKAIQIAPDFRFSTVPAFWSMPADGYVALALAYRRCNRPPQARAVISLGLLAFPDHPDLRALNRRLRGDRYDG